MSGKVFSGSVQMPVCAYKQMNFDFIITKIRHDHLVGFYVSEQQAIALESELLKKGIPSHRDINPYGVGMTRAFASLSLGRIFSERGQFWIRCP